MRITCPSCAAEYDVGAPLAAGRVVRCARCGREWAPVAALPPAAAAAPRVVEVIPPQPGPRAFLAPPASARPSARAHAPAPGGLALTAAWIGSFALVLALLAAAFTFRAPIMAAWPPSTRVYAALGLA